MDSDTWQGTILIAEDNTINMMLAKAFLLKALPKARIVEAASGVEAVEAFRTQRPDLILMDMQMPRMDGCEAARSIRELEPPGSRIPIIALTAAGPGEDRERRLAAGMDDYAAKPITLAGMRALCDRWLGTAGDPAADSPGVSRESVTGHLRGQGHDEETIREMMALLAERLPELKEDITRAVEAEDFSALAREAHSLKGIVRTIGHEELSSLTEKMEKAAIEKDGLSAQTLLPELRSKIDQLSATLEAGTA